MLESHFTNRIHDVINQLEHAMFMSDETRERLQSELDQLVRSRDKARQALRTKGHLAAQAMRRERAH